MNFKNLSTKNRRHLCRFIIIIWTLVSSRELIVNSYLKAKKINSTKKEQKNLQKRYRIEKIKVFKVYFFILKRVK